MKILVFSDSHTDVDSMYIVAEKEAPDMIFHLGDHKGDAELLHSMMSEIPILAVHGNCDLSHGASPVLEAQLKNRCVILTHGHEFSVKRGLNELYKYGKTRDADIILFGHTHIPYYEERGGILLANPGRAGRNAGRGISPTYGVLTLGKTAKWEHFMLD